MSDLFITGKLLEYLKVRYNLLLHLENHGEFRHVTPVLESLQCCLVSDFSFSFAARSCTLSYSVRYLLVALPHAR